MSRKQGINIINYVYSDSFRFHAEKKICDAEPCLFRKVYFGRNPKRYYISFGQYRSPKSLLFSNAVCPMYIQSEAHLVSKTYMTRVEGENTRLRHYLARLHRKTLCYSKSILLLKYSQRALHPAGMILRSGLNSFSASLCLPVSPSISTIPLVPLSWG